MNERPTRRWPDVIAVTCGFTAVAALYSLNPTESRVYPLCPFHSWTGLDCPGCGSLRAIHALMHGQWIQAVQFNAMLVLSLPIFAWIGFRYVRDRRQSLPPVLFKPVWLWSYAALWIVFGVLRNLPYPMFSRLAP